MTLDASKEHQLPAGHRQPIIIRTLITSYWYVLTRSLVPFDHLSEHSPKCTIREVNFVAAPYVSGMPSHAVELNINNEIMFAPKYQIVFVGLLSCLLIVQVP